MSHLQIVRWARFGHDRLYVKTLAGVQLGYWDNNGHVAYLEDEANRPMFDQVVAEYHSGRPGGCVPTSGSSDPATAVAHSEPRPAVPAPAELPTHLSPDELTPPPKPAPVATSDQLAPELVERVVIQGPPTVPGWTDMSANRAGAQCRQKADALRQAAPVRSFLARCLGVKNEERDWRIGADGEESVAAQLVKLDDRWRTLHAVLVGSKGGDIDHVIIGPAGIYTINTKNHPDGNIWVGGNTFMVNGYRVPHVHKARSEARRTTALLTTATGLVFPVTGLIVVVGAYGGYKIKEQPPGGDVYVLTRKELVKWLCRRPQTLTETQVDTLFTAARRSTTWRR